MGVESLKDQLGEDWYNVLKDRITDEDLDNIRKVGKEFKTKTIYPPASDTFRAYRESPYNDIKVVIIGQD